MLIDQFDVAEAIFFFDEQIVIKEMLYPEFEAVLDGYVPLSEFSGRAVKAVYGQIASGYRLKSVVFFNVSFDEEGWVDRSWNVPLQQLAETAKLSPDPKFSHIKLACKSHCEVSWQQKSLWDPELSNGEGDLKMLEETIRKNRLGIIFRQSSAGGQDTSNKEIPTLIEAGVVASEAVGQAQIESLNKQHRLEISLLKNKYQQQVADIKRQFASVKAGLEADNRELAERLKKERVNLQESHNQLEQQKSKISGLREYFEDKIRNEKQVDQGQLDVLKQNHLVEMQLQVSEATHQLEQELKEAKEQLDFRNVELMYMNTQEESLNSEIDRLTTENQELLATSGDRLLGTLESKGISFVAFQPGAGHMTISLVDLSRYLSNPVTYTAEFLGITLANYEAWKEHSKNPVCQAIDEFGGVCGKPIPRIEQPNQFFLGENDRCKEHISSSPFSDKS